MVALTKRLYVGNLHNNTEACLGELQGRFKKFGRCLSEDFENHGTFAYINMEFDDDAQFQRLRNSFNNVKFKGNELKVSEAKPDWKSSWETRKKQDEEDNKVLETEAKKRDWEYYKKIENIERSWEDRRNVIPGRIRKTPRSRVQMRNITFRLDVNGSLKVYKCYKTKLWGYERDKDVKDLVSKFVNNKWRNGEGHIVDRLDYSRAKRSLWSIVEERSPENKEDVEEAGEDEEKEKAKDVLASFMKDFEFDKPLQLSDDEENEVSSHRESKSNQTTEQKVDDTIPVEEPTLPKKDTTRPKIDAHNEGSESDNDEPIPTFTSAPNDSVTGQSETKTVNDTETLRSLFNPETDEPSNSFKLIAESDEDIDHKRDEEVEEVTATPQEIQELERPAQNKEKHHLFFPHVDSPFLVGQTMLSKLKTTAASERLSDWEEKFWENRGTWTKELKRRRRDALRSMNKKRAGKGSGLLL